MKVGTASLMLSPAHGREMLLAYKAGCAQIGPTARDSALALADIREVRKYLHIIHRIITKLLIHSLPSNTHFQRYSSIAEYGSTSFRQWPNLSYGLVSIGLVTTYKAENSTSLSSSRHIKASNSLRVVIRLFVSPPRM